MLHGAYSGRHKRPLLNDGSGRFAEVSDTRLLPVAVPSYAMALADLDEDGDADWLFSGWSARNRVFQNLHRHLAMQALTRIGLPLIVQIFAEPGYGGTHQALPLIATAGSHIPLPPLGVLRLHPATIVPLPAVMIGGTGMGEISPHVPRDPALVGQPVYMQALLNDTSGALRLTNAVADHIH